MSLKASGSRGSLVAGAGIWWQEQLGTAVSRFSALWDTKWLLQGGKTLLSDVPS